MKQVLISFLIIIFSSAKAQLDEYKMRQEQFSFQSKEQPLLELPQRATILDSNANKTAFEPFLHSLLENQAELYTTTSNFYSKDFFYRGEQVSNHFFVDNVLINSSLNFGRYYLIQKFDINHISKTEVQYGTNLTQFNSQNSAAIAIFNHSIDELNIENKLNIQPVVQVGNLYQYGGMGIQYHSKKNWADGFFFSYTGSNKNNLGDKELSYPMSYKFQFQNSFYKKWNENSSIKAYLSLNINSPFSNFGYLYDNIQTKTFENTQTSPFVFSYLQWKQTSVESKWYSQLLTSISYLHSFISDSISYDTFHSFRNEISHHKLSLQLNGYKNLGARAVYSYGFIGSIEKINSLHTPDPIAEAQFYFQKEIRQSSDVSWIVGGLASVEKFQSGNKNYILPKGSIHGAWSRHTCENSNYSLHLYLNLESPKFHQIQPLVFQPNLLPNQNLDLEKNIRFEGNLYRKFFERLEWNLSVYHSLSEGKILLKDNYGNSNDDINYYGLLLHTQIYKNAPLSSNFGLDNELKFHISKDFLIYHTAHFQKRNFHTSSADNYTYFQFPIYGNGGLKFKFHKLFTQIWVNYNLGYRMFSNLKTEYEINKQPYLHSYSSFHISSIYSLNKNWEIGSRLDNIFNQFGLSYLSQIPIQGFHGSVMVRVKL